MVSKSERRGEAVHGSGNGRGIEMVRLALDGRGDGAKPALREQLHILEGRLQRVQARGGAYAEVGLSMNVKMLLAKLEAGRVLSTGTH